MFSLDRDWNVLRLTGGNAGLFGYGSLLSIESMERTLGRSYDGVFVPCAVRGWRRTWDVAMPNRFFYAETTAGRKYPCNILYLNVRRDPESVLNGVLFVVKAGDLAEFDQREWIYDRQNIRGDILGPVVLGGDVFMYVGRTQYVMHNVQGCHQAAIRRTYLDILEVGLSELGEAFRSDYESSSDPVPAELVIDDRRDG